MAKEMIRIRLKAYDHQVIDQSAEKIVETAKRNGATFVATVGLRPVTLYDDILESTSSKSASLS